MKDNNTPITFFAGIATIVAGVTLNDIAVICGMFASLVAGGYTLWKWVHAIRAAKARKGAPPAGLPVLIFLPIAALVLCSCASTEPTREFSAAGTGLESIATAAKEIRIAADDLSPSPARDTIVTSSSGIITTVPGVRTNVGKLEKQLQEAIKRIEDLESRTSFWTCLVLRMLGIGLLLFAGLRIYFVVQSGGISLLLGALKGSSILLILGISLIALSSLLDQTWFWTVSYIVLGVSIAGTFGYFAYDLWRSQQHKLGESESDALLAKIAKCINANLGSTVKSLRDALSLTMTDEEKRGLDLISSGKPWE